MYKRNSIRLPANSSTETLQATNEIAQYISNDERVEPTPKILHPPRLWIKFNEEIKYFMTNNS